MRLSSFLHIYTHTHLGHMSERGSIGTSERDHLSEIIFMFSGFTFATSAHSISEAVARFFLYGFPEDKYFCLFSLVLIIVHVILLDKILRSYCLIDKNLTWYWS